MMTDYSSISSPSAATKAADDGELVRVFLLPAELGGRDVAQNVVFVPPQIREVKERSTIELLAAIRAGLTEIEVVPSYRGNSFVPDSITITASRPDAEPELRLVIGVW